ncbi:MAG: hypothetical protein MUE67_03890 [Anaerolineales bacterium]|jgi:hypothetical protein|nr:hypothetical protein [Anaerolineales bacterium]
MAESPTPETIVQMQRWFAVECNNACWALIDQKDRSPAQDREMLYCAYAAAYHWGKAGTQLNGARAELALAQVHSLLGHASLAMDYARSALEYFQQHPCEDWDLAFGHAALAFAAAVAGDADLHTQHYAIARRLGEAIADPQDRAIFLGSFASLPPPQG